MSTALILFAHGSRIESANDAVRAVAEEARRAGGYDRAEVAFLDPYPPSLAETATRLAADGVSRILVIPYFLTMGLHLQRDLPRIVDRVACLHPGIAFRLTPPLDGHPALAGIVLDRAREALEAWPPPSSTRE